MTTDILRGDGAIGRRLENEIVIDAHMHIDSYNKFFIPSSDTSSLIANARRLGIQRLYGSSLLAIRADATVGNKHVLDAQERYPDMFRPYLVVKPNYPEEISSVIELAEKRSVNRFKLHDDGNSYPYDHKNYSPLFEYCNEHNGVVLFHTYGSIHVLPIMNVAKRYPSLKIILGHSGIIDEQSYYDAVNKHDNIFLETCNSLAWYGLLERLVVNVGSHRILFGTDMPFMSPDQQIGRILFARISDDDKRNILGQNAQLLFNHSGC
jgi:predicted TIM-barrel fold metal-dependent hydrolase